MMDRQALFEKFLDLLETAPALPEYLEAEPESIAPFDPYQMVAEWIALRHEIKQQGKLVQVSQNTLQQAFEALQIEKEQQHREVGQQGMSDQKALWRDLLTVLDALDQACAYWQAQIDALASPLPPSQPAVQPFWQRWIQQVAQPPKTASAESTSLRDVLVSNQQGVDLIRRSLLDLLRQRQVMPIAALGSSFNPQTMYAVGRQESASAPENTVIQEVVRGYLWGDQVLRLAQVIVAAKQAAAKQG